MKESTKEFRIGALAQQLGVKRFVIRFWEKEFSIPSHRSTGGQRFYQSHDIEQFKLIKKLLYEKGFTISGAKKILREANKEINIMGSHKVRIEQKKISSKTPEKISEQIIVLQKQLIKLRKLL
jgi:DNA-binding transcriptional MerR regulator